MAQIIGASIDLAKIDRSKVVSHPNGGKYYNVSIIINDEADNYGNDVAITEGQTKEEREQKAKKKYIGNGCTVWTGKSAGAQQKQQTFNDGLNDPMSVPMDDDLPF